MNVFYLNLAGSENQMPLIYLSNDLIQSSNHSVLIFLLKQFLKAFENVLIDIIPDILDKTSKQNKQEILRVISIWKKREIYSKDIIDKLLNEENKGIIRDSNVYK